MSKFDELVKSTHVSQLTGESLRAALLQSIMLNRVLVFTLILLVIAVTVLSTGVFNVEPKYFAVTKEGKVTPIAPLVQPIVSKKAVKNFSVSNVTDALSVNFRQWKTQLATVEDNFTVEGFTNYLDEFASSGWKERIEKDFATVSATPTDVPVVTKEGIARSAVYTWIVEFPILVRLESPKKTSQQHFNMRVTVVRVPYVKNDMGIAISQIIQKPI